MPSRLSCRLGWHRWQPLRAPGDGGWYKKCRVCGTRDDDDDDGLPLIPVVLSASVLVAGVALSLTLQTLLGDFLIVGAVGALGVAMLPTVLERIGGFLSTGSLRRKPWR